jgi:prepilin-type N-terminal cleavage/methylation domain-containing protein
MDPQPADDQPRGFTWVEVIVAMLLMGVGLLAIAPVFLVAARSSAAATDLEVVGARAAHRMEVLRQIPFDELFPGGDLSADVDGFVDTADPGCVLRWSVADDAQPPTRKTITVLALAARRPVGLQKEVRLTLVRSR